METPPAAPTSTTTVTSANTTTTTTNNTTNANNTDTSGLVAKSEVKFRESMYRLIISQLFYDGYQHAAVNLSAAIQATPPCPPSNRLYNLIKTAVKQESSSSSPSPTTNGVPPATDANGSNNSSSNGVDESSKASDDVVMMSSKRLVDYEPEGQTGSNFSKIAK